MGPFWLINDSVYATFVTSCSFWCVCMYFSLVNSRSTLGSVTSPLRNNMQITRRRWIKSLLCINSVMLWQWTFPLILFRRQWFLTASLWLCRWYYFFPLTWLICVLVSFAVDDVLIAQFTAPVIRSPVVWIHFSTLLVYLGLQDKWVSRETERAAEKRENTSGTFRDSL